jgi:hypothetical protein
VANFSGSIFSASAMWKRSSAGDSILPMVGTHSSPSSR